MSLDDNLQNLSNFSSHSDSEHELESELPCLSPNVMAKTLVGQVQHQHEAWKLDCKAEVKYNLQLLLFATTESQLYSILSASLSNFKAMA